MEWTWDHRLVHGNEILTVYILYYSKYFFKAVHVPRRASVGIDTCLHYYCCFVGNIRNLSAHLWNWRHLTALYINNNSLSRLPPEVCHLQCLMHLDLSSNKLRSLPAEIGEMYLLRELLLSNNQLRLLPLEIGNLFLLHKIGKPQS